MGHERRKEEVRKSGSSGIVVLGSTTPPPGEVELDPGYFHPHPKDLDVVFGIDYGVDVKPERLRNVFTTGYLSHLWLEQIGSYTAGAAVTANAVTIHEELSSIRQELKVVRQLVLDLKVFMESWDTERKRSERKRILEAANAGFTALRNNPSAWAEELEERHAWDSTLSDGLTDE